ncbi:short-chain dehydrogenase of unknown substrate specificity [Thioflavicoccus mobilis 8321]|uniref:Short-chain dehydrogenase n=1 Tax=Thioflavicoccus mobilis 8321 TaxID=765912 RepID=L0GQM0_9GAMM|nr:SDR family NAD(P)-dependent oxidoreductase [Thioflavicoccus mobilis]AGA89033.1 short-chain dehydrogenase of unknown substrate specificity [Thioflavicoccus mobilis 8321]
MPQEDKAILITGCSSGIGHACAQGLARRGYQVIASARGEADVARLREEGLTAVRLDVDDPASIAEAVAATLELTGGRLWGLFNNAGYGQPGAVEDLTREALRAQLETNLLGAHDLTCRLIPVMRRQGGGRIVQNSSLLGLIGLHYRGAYVASKFALEGLTDTLRLELHGSGIQVSLIEPGPITSRFRDNAYAMWRHHVDARHSRHRQAYEAMESRLLRDGPVQPFTLPPEAVLKRLIHALESPRPRPRYSVTLPTHLVGAARRLLPTRGLDWLTRRISRGGAG